MARGFGAASILIVPKVIILYIHYISSLPPIQKLYISMIGFKIRDASNLKARPKYLVPHGLLLTNRRHESPGLRKTLSNIKYGIAQYSYFIMLDIVPYYSVVGIVHK